MVRPSVGWAPCWAEVADWLRLRSDSDDEKGFSHTLMSDSPVAGGGGKGPRAWAPVNYRTGRAWAGGGGEWGRLPSWWWTWSGNSLSWWWIRSRCLPGVRNLHRSWWRDRQGIVIHIGWSIDEKRDRLVTYDRSELERTLDSLQGALTRVGSMRGSPYSHFDSGMRLAIGPLARRHLVDRS